jgi:hypothetical protein
MLFADKIKWIGTVFTLGGALTTSLGIDPLNIILFNIGSLLFLWWGYLIKEKAMQVVNAGLLLIYLTGMFLRV